MKGVRYAVCALSTLSKQPKTIRLKSSAGNYSISRTMARHNPILFQQTSQFHTSWIACGMDISSIELAGHCTRYKPDWTLHECKLKCIHEKRPKGMEFLVRYIDTAASLPTEVRDNMPVVVATHGSPGSYKDLVLVIEPLIDKGARLVLPNMPGFDYTQFVDESDKFDFRHTTTERLNFLKAFLSAVDIPRLDFAVGHSAGAYPITVLAAEMKAKGAALVSPAPGHTYPRAAEPVWLTKFVDLLVTTPSTHKFGLWLLDQIGRIVSGIPAKNIDHMVAVLQNATGIEFDMICAAVERLEKRLFPVIFFYCEKDPIVWCHDSEKYAKAFGITPKMTDHVNEEGVLTEEGIPDPKRHAKALRFPKRSHYPQKDPVLIEVMKKEVEATYMVAIGDHQLTKSEASQQQLNLKAKL